MGRKSYQGIQIGFEHWDAPQERKLGRKYKLPYALSKKNKRVGEIL